VWQQATMWALAVLQLTAVAGSLTRMPLVSTARCPRVAVTRSNSIVMRQQDADSVVLALTRAKSPRSGRAELVELQRAVDAASGARLDPALIREARSLLAGVKDGGKPSAASVAKDAAARQLATSLARAKSARSGRAELAELSRALDAATAARVDGGAIREAREMVAAKGRAAAEKAAAEKAVAEKAAGEKAASLGLLQPLEALSLDADTLRRVTVAAVAYCNAQGAASVADLVEHDLLDGLMAALALKPIPAKRLLISLKASPPSSGMAKRHATEAPPSSAAAAALPSRGAMGAALLCGTVVVFALGRLSVGRRA